jgi:hypothetical protein
MSEKEEQTIKILEKFKQMNPWEGDVGSRISKFNWCFKELKKIYNKEEYALVCSVATETKFWYSSRGSYTDTLGKVIVLKGRLSVITFLHEFAHAFGMDEEGARQWSKNLFKKVWPEKYEKLVEIDGLMININGGDDGGD